MSPAHSFDLAIRAIADRLADQAPWLVAVAAGLVLVTALVEWVRHLAAGGRRGSAAVRPGLVPMARRGTLSSLAAAASVHAPLSHAAAVGAAAANHVAPRAQDLPTLSAQEAALAQFASGTCVATGQGPDGRPVCTPVTSLEVYSLHPPSVVLSLPRHESSPAPDVCRGAFGVHLLARHPARTANARDEADRGILATADWRWERDIPVFEGAVSYLRCRPAGVDLHGREAVVVAEVHEAVIACAQREPLRPGGRSAEPARSPRRTPHAVTPPAR